MQHLKYKKNHAWLFQVVEERYNDVERELMKEKEARACLKQEIERLVSSEQRVSKKKANSALRAHAVFKLKLLCIHYLL